MIGATDRLISSQIDSWITKPRGKIFFVDGGSTGPIHDNNDGLSPYTPLRTFAAALAKTVDKRDDVVFVINYGANAQAVESFPITVNTEMVHIIGIQCMDNSKWPTISSHDAGTHAFDITKGRVELANLEIGGNAAGAGVHVGSVAGIWSTCIHDVWFGVTGDTVGQYGVYVAATEDAPFLEVYDCRFGGFLTKHGIFINGNATRGILGKQGHGNKFLKVTEIAMNISGPAGLDMIVDNLFSLPSDTLGYAITMSALSSGALVSGNKAGFKIAAMTNNPFRDLSNANHWIDNWRQGLTIAPDTV